MLSNVKGKDNSHRIYRLVQIILLNEEIKILNILVCGINRQWSDYQFP